jgi:hypothetical protein
MQWGVRPCGRRLRRSGVELGGGAAFGVGPAVARPALPPRTFGAALPGVPSDLTELSAVTTLTGRAPESVTWYAAWATSADFPAAAAGRVAATGATPEVTWEPWDPAAGASQPAYSLRAIAGGAHDAYLATWAREIRSYAKPVTIRLAHEMNGDWYPWAERVNGNAPGDYVAAWRHVVDVFRANKATNVTWRWSPNVPYYGSTSLATLYPGDAYVDQVALDGYNWGGVQSGASWVSFADVFGSGVAQLRALTTRPLYVGEVGCPESGGDKAAWVDDMFAWLQAHPEVRGFTWFNYVKETDWRIQSSDASMAAFRRGLVGFR